MSIRWRAEGIPDILVESKIAEIAVIVSDHNFSSEKVIDEVDGLIITENASQELSICFQKTRNSKKLQQMRVNAKESAEKYFIESYISHIWVI